jgi:hypothetical protein
MDQRSSLARQLHSRLLGISDDQGGSEAMSVIARSLAERYVHAEALAVAIEARAAAGEQFDTPQYLAILDRLARLGQALGLERKARPVQSLAEYIAAHPDRPPAEGGKS